MRDDQKTKADLLQELSTLRRRVSGLKQASEEWARTFDATSDLVFVQDKDFKFVKVNKSVCDLLITDVKMPDTDGIENLSLICVSTQVPLISVLSKW